MTVKTADVRSLLTKSELVLFEASSPKSLATLSAARLKQKIALARKLRDKWADQSRQQRREKQSAQQARSTSANARSEEKADLFSQVLARFEKQLEKTEASGAAGDQPKRGAPSRKTRSKEHRETRAATRSALQDQQDAISLERASRKAAPAKVVAGKASLAKKKIVKKKAVNQGVAKKKPGKKSAKKSVETARAATSQAAAAPKPAAVKKKTLRATTVAKQTRVEQGGKVRIQKHLSAQGRRNQTRRDSRR